MVRDPGPRAATGMEQEGHGLPTFDVFANEKEFLIPMMQTSESLITWKNQSEMESYFSTSEGQIKIFLLSAQTMVAPPYLSHYFFGTST